MANQSVDALEGLDWLSGFIGFFFFAGFFLILSEGKDAPKKITQLLFGYFIAYGMGKKYDADIIRRAYLKCLIDSGDSGDRVIPG